MAIQKYVEPELYKIIDSDKRFVKEKTVIGSETTITGISWTYLQRDATTYNSDLKGLLASVGMSLKFFSSQEYYPIWEKLGQLRQANVAVGALQRSGYSGSIDAQSLTVCIPSAATAGGYNLLYGATFDSEDNLSTPNVGQDETWIPTVGSVAWLFSDNIATPYSGTVYGGKAGHGVANWSGHPVATSYYAGDTGHDTPQGFMVLDKGLIVITNSTFVDTDWATAWQTRLASSGGTRRKEVYTGESYVTFKPKTITIENVYFCHCEPHEFTTTQNESYNKNKAFYKPNLADPLWVTEVVLLNEDDEIVATAKLSEPIRKDKYEPITFKVVLSI